MSTPKEPGSFAIIGTLALAGLLSGLILVVVFLATQPNILANKARALEAAVQLVVPNAASAQPFEFVGGKLQPYKGPQGVPSKNPTVYAALNPQGQLAGYAISAEGPGFSDTIKLIYGFDAKTGRIIGMKVLESRETPGLGDKILSDTKFLSNFNALSVKPSIVPVKSGARTLPNQVDCITGATISSKAVVKILNSSTQQWVPRLSAGN
jgi:electron transport complex protein RnfG